MTIRSACIRTLSCLALSFFPLITSAQIPVVGAWPQPLPPLALSRRSRQHSARSPNLEQR